MQGAEKKRHLIIVEDSPEDLEMMLRAFKKASIDHTVHSFSDGDLAIEFFKNYEKADLNERSSIDHVLLDLNLPGTDGFEVLEFLKKNESLKMIPVTVMSSSNRKQDIDRSYELGANSYICKPFGTVQITAAAFAIKNFWLELVKLPSLT